MTNRQKFVASYARRLRTHSDCNPGVYARPKPGEDAEAFWLAAADFTAGHIAGGWFGRLDTPAQAALKELDVEPTTRAAKEYLTADASGDTLSHA